MISVYRSSETSLGEKRKLRAARGSGITATRSPFFLHLTRCLRTLRARLQSHLWWREGLWLEQPFSCARNKGTVTWANDTCLTLLGPAAAKRQSSGVPATCGVARLPGSSWLYLFTTERERRSDERGARSPATARLKWVITYVRRGDI